MKKLIAVDDQPITHFITRKLSEINRFEGAIEYYTNPVLAIEKVLYEEDLVILLDLNMPEMNGWEFIENLEKRNIHHEIIILTSSTSEYDKLKAEKYNSVVNLITKPLNKDKFLRIIDFL